MQPDVVQRNCIITNTTEETNMFFFLHKYLKNLNILMDTGEDKMQQV